MFTVSPPDYGGIAIFKVGALPRTTTFFCLLMNYKRQTSSTLNLLINPSMRAEQETGEMLFLLVKDSRGWARVQLLLRLALLWLLTSSSA